MSEIPITIMELAHREIFRVLRSKNETPEHFNGKLTANLFLMERYGGNFSFEVNLRRAFDPTTRTPQPGGKVVDVLGVVPSTRIDPNSRLKSVIVGVEVKRSIYDLKLRLCTLPDVLWVWLTESFGSVNWNDLEDWVGIIQFNQDVREYQIVREPRMNPSAWEREEQRSLLMERVQQEIEKSRQIVVKKLTHAMGIISSSSAPIVNPLVKNVGNSPEYKMPNPRSANSETENFKATIQRLMKLEQLSEEPKVLWYEEHRIAGRPLDGMGNPLVYSPPVTLEPLGEIPELIQVEYFARILGRSKEALVRQCQTGCFDHFLIGGEVFMTKKDFSRSLERSKQAQLMAKSSRWAR